MLRKIELFFAYIFVGILTVILKVLEFAWMCVKVVFFTALEIVKFLLFKALSIITGLFFLGYAGTVLGRWLVQGQFSLAL